MHKKTLILGIILGAALTGSGMFAWSAINDQPGSNKEQSTQQEDKQKNPVFTQAAPEGDLESGDGLTSVQMFQELQRVTDPEEFNRKYLTYMLLLRNNEGGMSSFVASKSNRQELKDAATQSMEADDAFIKNMRLWQSLWGYTEH